MVFHDHINQPIIINHCKNKNCFNQSLIYKTSTKQIKKLIEISKKCYQEIWFSCISTNFTGNAGWIDRNGNIHEYFSNNNSNICDCLQTKSCFSIHGCNCDSGDIVPHDDMIRITNSVSIYNRALHNPASNSAVPTYVEKCNNF